MKLDASNMGTQLILRVRDTLAGSQHLKLVQFIDAALDRTQRDFRENILTRDARRDVLSTHLADYGIQYLRGVLASPI